MEESYVVKLAVSFGKWLTIFHNFSVSDNQDHGKEYKRSDFNKYSIVKNNPFFVHRRRKCSTGSRIK